MYSTSSSNFLSFSNPLPARQRPWRYNEFRDPPCAAANERPRGLRHNLPPPISIDTVHVQGKCMTTSHLDDQVQNVVRKGVVMVVVVVVVRAVLIVLNLLRAFALFLPFSLSLSLSLCVHPSHNSS